jgi:hypothetical protein
MPRMQHTQRKSEAQVREPAQWIQQACTMRWAVPRVTCHVSRVTCHVSRASLLSARTDASISSWLIAYLRLMRHVTYHTSHTTRGSPHAARRTSVAMHCTNTGSSRTCSELSGLLALHNSEQDAARATGRDHHPEKKQCTKPANAVHQSRKNSKPNFKQWRCTLASLWVLRIVSHRSNAGPLPSCEGYEGVEHTTHSCDLAIPIVLVSSSHLI